MSEFQRCHRFSSAQLTLLKLISVNFLSSCRYRKLDTDFSTLKQYSLKIKMPQINKISLSEKCLDFIVKNIDKFCMKSGKE